jgi:hypothetical protein
LWLSVGRGLLRLRLLWRRRRFGLLAYRVGIAGPAPLPQGIDHLAQPVGLVRCCFGVPLMQVHRLVALVNRLCGAIRFFRAGRLLLLLRSIFLVLLPEGLEANPKVIGRRLSRLSVVSTALQLMRSAVELLRPVGQLFLKCCRFLPKRLNLTLQRLLGGLRLASLGLLLRIRRSRWGRRDPRRRAGKRARTRVSRIEWMENITECAGKEGEQRRCQSESGEQVTQHGRPNIGGDAGSSTCNRDGIIAIPLGSAVEAGNTDLHRDQGRELLPIPLSI